jgi:hypothetical protein
VPTFTKASYYNSYQVTWLFEVTPILKIIEKGFVKITLGCTLKLSYHGDKPATGVLKRLG